MSESARQAMRRKSIKSGTRTRERRLRVESLEARSLLTIVSLTPVHDNTLYEYKAGTVSSGAGTSLAVGIDHWTMNAMRGLMEFDVAGAVPAGATINNVTLSVWVNLTASTTGVEPTVELHKTLADWGEGASAPSGFMPPYGTAKTGDATWLHTFYNTQLWAAPGGDFSPTVSGSAVFGADNTYSTFSSTPQMAADVQSWLNAPATNFGWLLKDNETQESGKMIDSRESTTVAHRPTLTIDYTLAAANIPPTLDAIANPAPIDKNAGLQTVNLAGISAGAGETQALQVTATSSNAALIPTPSVAYASPAATGALTYQPAADQAGTADITVTVRDAGSDGILGNTDDGVVSRTFTVVVNQTNAPPTLGAIADPAAIDENAGLQTVNLTGISAGAGESQALQVTATSSNAALIPTPSVAYTSPAATGALTYQPAANMFGTSTITVTVRDAGVDGVLGNADDGTAVRSFTATVNDVNQTPTLEVIPDPLPINKNAGVQTIQLSGITAGAGDAQAVQITATSDNTALIPDPTAIYTSPSATGSISYQPVADQAGTANITVTVRDAGLDGVVGNTDDAAFTRVFTVVVSPTILPPNVSISDVSVAEGVSGGADVTFNVSLSAPSDQAVTVEYKTTDGAAVAGSDYVGGAGTVTFAPGETLKTVTVSVSGDAVVELDENFTVDLSNAQNAVIADSQGVGTITNDDSAALSINDVTLAEGAAGTTSFTFTVTLSAAVDSPFSVDFATADGTATTADGDYQAASGALNFSGAAGETQTITVLAGGDAKAEPDETFLVNLSNVAAGGRGVTLADNQGVGAITNDDASSGPALTITDVTMSEGVRGTTRFTFTVTLTEASSGPVTVRYATSDGTAVAVQQNHGSGEEEDEDNDEDEQEDNGEGEETAGAASWNSDGGNGNGRSGPGDYVGVSGALTFAGQAGETKTITVIVLGDKKVEADETFYVGLTDAVGAAIADAQGVGTIQNDDRLSTPTLWDRASSHFYVRGSNSTGIADRVFGYGAPQSNWTPLSGDWNGDGDDGVGVYDPATGAFYLRDAIDEGFADYALGYGANGKGWIPLAGDWDGDGVDTVGAYDPATSAFYLRNSLTSGVADVAYGFGAPHAGWQPLVGDWDGDGVDTVGLYAPKTAMFYLRDSNSVGVANHALGFGAPNSKWVPIVGDWTGSGTDAIGLYDPATSMLYQRHSLTEGIADAAFGFGAAGAGWLPLAGRWNVGGAPTPKAPMAAAMAATPPGSQAETAPSSDSDLLFAAIGDHGMAALAPQGSTTGAVEADASDTAESLQLGLPLLFGTKRAAATDARSTGLKASVFPPFSGLGGSVDS